MGGSVAVTLYALEITCLSVNINVIVFSLSYYMYPFSMSCFGLYDTRICKPFYQTGKIHSYT